MKRVASFFCLVNFLLIAVGCDSAKDRTYDVSGTVNLDKKPLQEGQIKFADSSGQVPAVITITDGKYKGKARAGSYNVEICAFRPSQKVIPKGPGMDKEERQQENYLPERFNTKSQLKMAEVTPSGPNNFDFEVESK